MVAGLALATVAVQNVALATGRFAPTSPLSNPHLPLLFVILQIISSLAIPLGILVGLLGLLALLGASSEARWGVRLAAVATLLPVIQSVVPYSFFIGSPDASPSSGAIGTMIFLSHALYVLSSLVLAAGLGLLFVAARRDQKLGTWRMLLLAIAIAAVLSSTAPFALAAVGLTGDMALSEVSEFVMGFLWVALGVALWRHAPQNQNVGTTPLIS
jgi:hypothetical protein